MAGGDLLVTSISGLLSFQRSLATTGHNITNSSTPGYSRQRVELVTRPSTPAGDGFIGNGVRVSTISRVYDQFVASQLTLATTANGGMQEFYRLATRVDDLLADPQAGLNPALQRFFNAVNDLANDPTSTTNRQSLLAEAQSLATRFHYLDDRLDELRRGINTEISNTANEINAIARSIADVNRDIVLSSGAAVGQPPNDLLDRRDELVNQLAERVAVRTVNQDDGSLSVFIGNGQTLVTGFRSDPISAVPSVYDPSRYEVGYTVGGSTVYITDTVKGQGGRLGAALDFREQVLDGTQNAMGRAAIGLADTMNAQHALGLDLYNALGGNFFQPIDNTSSTVYANTFNTGTAQFAATVTSSSALTVSDYSLYFDGANYTLTRLSDNTTVGTYAGFPITAEGFTLTLTAGAAVAGDSYVIQPTRNGARDFGVAIVDPARIAAASPVRAGEATNASGVPTNLGTSRITQPVVSNTTNLPLPGNVTLTFDPNAGGAGVPGFNVAGGPPGPLLYDPATEYGGKSFTFATYGGMSFTISGVPQTGDAFVLSNNLSGVSDNRNALTLADLRNQLTLAGGTATYENAYGQLVADVGTKTHQADISRQAQQTLYNKVKDSMDSVSAVNLDEEAANMVRFQQAYQAAAQMISVTDTLFQTLIGAVRR